MMSASEYNIGVYSFEEMGFLNLLPGCFFLQVERKDMDQNDKQKRCVVDAYDDDAEAARWYRPEVAFGLAYEYLHPGQSILDIGIGTGLGSVLFRKAGLDVHGKDASREMLDACRSKGFTALTLHDLERSPYPYDAESMDHAICVGVLNFFSDLPPIFEETARVLRRGGLFVFVVGDREENEPGLESAV